MMKRLLLFTLAACCLMAAAHARTVPEQVAAPPRAQGTWHSPTGRTTISLDAEVIVPEVDNLPIVEVFPRIFAPEEVHALADADGMAVLLITHNLGLVAGRMARVYVMYAGHVVESGAVTDVLSAPRHPYTRGLLAAVPMLDAPRHALPQPLAHALQTQIDT